MLKIITISSIKATITQAESNPCDDVQNPSLINYMTNSTTDYQEKRNMQSVKKTYKSKKKSTYFSIKSNNEKYLHSFEEIGELVQFDPTIHFVNQTKGDNTQEYLYCYGNNYIYNKPTVRTSRQEYQSLIINMVVDHEVKIQILVNNPQTEKFDLECIARGDAVLFSNLTGDERKMYVSSLIYFFKYHGKFYCSIQQVKPKLTIEQVKDYAKENVEDFTYDFFFKNPEVTSEHTVKQIELILKDENYVAALLDLEDCVDHIQLPITCVNKYNTYNCKYWKSENAQICNSADTRGRIYSVDDKMMTKFGYYSDLEGNELPFIWKITAQNAVKIFKILNPEPGKYFYGKVACKRVFISSPICFNQQTTPPKREYVFLRFHEDEKTLFCRIIEDGQYQTAKDCDINKIRLILETTNVFYSLTFNTPVPEQILSPIIEESEISSDVESSNDNVNEYITCDENVLISTYKQFTFNEKVNTLEDNLIRHTLEQEINEADNQIENDSNTTKEGDEKINDNQKEFVSSEVEVTTNLQDTVYMNDHFDNEATLHEKEDYQLKLESLEEKVIMIEEVNLLDPINKLVSEDKIVLSENTNIPSVSIDFGESEELVKEVSLKEDIEILKNEKDLYPTPFTYNTNNEVFAEQSANEIPQNSKENLQNDSTENLIKNSSDEDLKNTRKNASESRKGKQSNSLINRIRNFFRNLWARIRTLLKIHRK